MQPYYAHGIWSRLLRHRWHTAAGTVLVLVLVALVSSLGVPTSRARSADIAVTLLPTPNIGVPAGSVIDYELRVQNFGGGRADKIFVHMPYNPSYLRVLDAHFASSEDWVHSVGSDHVGLTFGGLDGQGAARSATIRMLVLPTVPLGTVIDMWAGYGWDGDDGGGSGYSANAAPLVVQTAPAAGPWAWLAVGPQQGVAGTVFQFYTNRLLPNEQTIIAINTPFGVQEISRDWYVNPQGEIGYEFVSVGYPPGDYTMSIRGVRSGITAAATFTIE